MSSPLNDIAESYIDECGVTISPEVKKEALEIMNKMLIKAIGIDEGVNKIMNLIGTPTPAQKLKIILEISEDPIKTSKKEFSEKNKISGRTVSRNWSTYEDQRLLAGIYRYGLNEWEKVAEFIGNNRTKSQCSQRWLRGLNPKIIKGPWTPEEEEELLRLVDEYGDRSWKKISNILVNRSDAQCRYHFLQLQKGRGKLKDDNTEWLPPENSQTYDLHSNKSNSTDIINSQSENNPSFNKDSKLNNLSMNNSDMLLNEKNSAKMKPETTERFEIKQQTNFKNNNNIHTINNSQDKINQTKNVPVRSPQQFIFSIESLLNREIH